jgi:fucose permease
MANVVAVAVIGLSIAPIFPAMMSGTKTRVGDQYAANTIGMQMAATGFGTAVIPSLMGVLARRISQEIIPVCLLVVYAGLFGFYVLAARPQRLQATTASASSGHTIQQQSIKEI